MEEITIEKLWTYDELRYNEKNNPVPYLNKSATKRVLDFMKFIGRDIPEDTERLRYSLSEIELFLSQPEVKDKIENFYSTLDKHVKNKIEKENMEENRIIEFFETNYSMEKQVSQLDIINCIKQVTGNASSDYVIVIYYSILFKYKYSNCSGVKIVGTSNKDENNILFKDISDEVFANNDNGGKVEQPSRKKTLDDLNYVEDLLDYLKYNDENISPEDIEKWLYEKGYSGQGLTIILSELRISSIKQKDKIINFFESKYDKASLEKGFSLTNCIKKEKTISDIKTWKELEQYLKNNEVSKEELEQWMNDNIGSYNEIELFDFVNNNMSMDSNREVVLQYLQNNREVQSSKFINPLIGEKSPEEQVDDFKVPESPVLSEAKKQKITEKLVVTEYKLPEQPEEIVIDDEQTQLVLKIKSHRKALSSVKRKKVIYAALAGVCTLSAIIMTIGYKITPVEVVKACEAFIDKIGIDEFRQKMGPVSAYVSYVLSIIGIPVFGNLTANQFEPEDARKKQIEKEIEKLNEIVGEETEDKPKSI